MPDLLANVPEGIVWGRVTAYVTSFVADGGTALPDGTPDAIPLNGTITLTPTVGVMVFPTLTPPQQAVIQSLACPVIGGVLYAPGTTPENVGDRDPGVILVASEQPLGLPDRVQYRVTWALEGAQVTPVTIDVPSQGTVDLATVIPATPGPGKVVVVSTVDRERAEDAAAAAAGSAGSAFDDAVIAQGARLGAEAARGAAEAAADTAETAATVAVTAKNLAEGFAGDAETARSETTTARDEAVTARNQAVTARSETTTARDETVTARNQAVTAREDAETASNQAVTARNQAVTAKNMAEGFAGDAETALTSTLAAAVYELRGTGQPGSTTETDNAPVGAYYTDTAGTAGAWRWLKTATGSGVARWTVVYGDTGWRDVAPDNHQLGGTGFVKARRNGSQVELSIRIGPDKSYSGINTGIVIPTGFRKRAGTVVSSPARRTNNLSVDIGTTAYFATALTGDNLYLWGSIPVEFIFLFNYHTTDRWPTTLPGTPA